MRRSRVSATIGVLAASVVLTACTSGSDVPREQADQSEQSQATQAAPTELPSTAWKAAERQDIAQGGTLRLAVTSLPANFNPLHSVGGDAAEILAPTTGSAIRIGAGGTWSVDPNYARSVKVTSKNPLTVRVRLNRKAVWQGGTPITAADMIAFAKAADGSNDAYAVSSTNGYDQIASVTQGKDRFEYSVTFKKPTADWPQFVYPRLAANVSKSPKRFNTAFRQRAISSNGPFMVSAINRARGTITQVPNPRWWGQAPRLSKIVWHVTDAKTAVKAFNFSELDAVEVNAETIDDVKDASTLQRAAGSEWSQVTINGGRGVLREPRVRRAVASAINRDEFAKAVAEPVGAPPAPLGSLLTVPGQDGYQDSSQHISYNPKRVQTLLTKAGFTRNQAGMFERDGKVLTLRMPVPRETPANAARAELVKTNLEAAGIAVQIREVQGGDAFFNNVIVPLEFDLVTFMREATPFPLTASKPLYFPLDSPQNFSGIGSPRIGGGFDTVLGTLDDDLRKVRIAKLDEWLFTETAAVPLAVTPTVVAVRSELVNYGATQFEQPDWTAVGFTR